tara:strand:- start:2742 stop:3278 length:537 start_codon:yes stop_codon:yes gene_type:complete
MPHTRNHKKRRNTRRAGAPKGPYAKDGNLNPFWVKEINSNAHASFVVDPKGLGTFCHITLEVPGDKTTYHYGFEVRNAEHRARGRHFWTNPYVDDHKLTPAIRAELVRLYKLHCVEGRDESSPGSSSGSKSRKKSPDDGWTVVTSKQSKHSRARGTQYRRRRRHRRRKNRGGCSKKKR